MEDPVVGVGVELEEPDEELELSVLLLEPLEPVVLLAGVLLDEDRLSVR